MTNAGRAGSSNGAILPGPSFLPVHPPLLHALRMKTSNREALLFSHNRRPVLTASAAGARVGILSLTHAALMP